MDVRTTDNEVRILKSVSEEFSLFFTRTLPLLQNCEERVQHSLSHFSAIEQELDVAFRKGAAMIAAAILHSTSKESSVLAQVQNIHQSSDVPLRSPERRTLFVRLLCGLLIQVTTLYCAPQGKRTDATEARAGLYPELAAYGFAKNSSAALEDRVTRRVALCPSFEVATRELNHEGVQIDVKEVRRIALQCGETLLATRYAMVQSFLAGTLVPGKELSGKRVVVEVDGGRMKQRENKAKTKNVPGEHPRFNTEWREPKLLTIYTVNERGKKEKDSQVWMDATFQGADHTAELVAAWLYRLGISEASSVTFIADGATWIWDRFDWIVENLELPKEKVQYILDFCHAAHHISLALGELSFEEGERLRLYKELRSDLKKSRWQAVVSRLEELGGDFLSDGESIFCRELRFLRKHGEANHLNYVTYSRRGLPLGSGAVESAIRRVINLRLKSNGMFWTAANAESMLQVRCQLLSTEWAVRLEELYKHRLRSRRRDWKWQASDRSRKSRNEMEILNKNNKNA